MERNVSASRAFPIRFYAAGFGQRYRLQGGRADEALTGEDEDILNYDDLDDPDAFV